MPGDLARDELARLRATVATLQADVAAQRGELARLKRRRRLPRRLVPLALVALLVALLPLSLLAAGPFGDLNPGSPHNGNIQAIADAGITRGCDPPAFVSYCPGANVTREEMASFLARTAGLGGNPPVANALTAQTAANAANATNATSAGNATTVGGFAPNGLLRVARGSGFTNGNPLYLTAAYQTIAAATIATPGPGFVLVQGTATISNGASCNAATRLRDTTAALDSTSPLAITMTGTAAGQAHNMPATPTWVFATPGGGRTIVLESRIATGDGCAAIDGMLTALFAPFGPGGTGALGTEDRQIAPDASNIP